jgi:hypothetical protein
MIASLFHTTELRVAFQLVDIIRIQFLGCTNPDTASADLEFHVRGTTKL